MTFGAGLDDGEARALSWEPKAIENGKRQRRIHAAITRFQKELRLTGWDIRYNPEWKKKWSQDSSARTSVHAGNRVASVKIDPEVTGDNIDYHVAHELMHLVIYDLHQMLGQTAAKTGPGGEAIIDWMAPEIERICNTVAYALTGVLFEPVGKDRAAFAPWVA